MQTQISKNKTQNLDNGQASSASPKSVIRPNNPFFAAQQAVQAKKAAAQMQASQEEERMEGEEQLGLAAEESLTKNNPVEHIVQAGDTAYQLARFYGMTVQELADLNQREVARKDGQDFVELMIGETLQVIDRRQGQRISETPSEASLGFHMVEAGQTAYSIARFYNMSLDELTSLNGLVLTQDESGQDYVKLDPGQKLRVYQEGTLLTPQKDDLTHTILPQETLYGVSRIYGVTVEELKELNHLTSDEIKAGDVLKIPASAASRPPMPLQKEQPSDVSSSPEAVPRPAYPHELVLVASGPQILLAYRVKQKRTCTQSVIVGGGLRPVQIPKPGTGAKISTISGSAGSWRTGIFAYFCA
ncbi:MAG: LysM peptidoglycan-binding domain-containing protein [Bacteroidia bacterium]|nr:LysM peptidoglycan-binding domain-containing protein [Bacteroidia bacterium]